MSLNIQECSIIHAHVCQNRGREEERERKREREREREREEEEDERDGEIRVTKKRKAIIVSLHSTIG